MEQRSENWHNKRLGKLTASKFPDLMKNGRGKDTIGQTAKSYIQSVAVEAITGVHEEIYSYHLQWGEEHEPDAFELVNKSGDYNFTQSIFNEYKGNIPELVNFVGGTPDGENGTHVLEIKCPSNSANHFKRVLEPQTLVDEYLYQVLGEMLVTGKDKAIMASYDPRFPIESRLVIIEITAEQYKDQMDALKERLILSVNELRETFKKYRNAIKK